MLIYRLTNSKYKDDLSGYGSYLYGGRWNSKSTYALYAAEHISLAVLEIAVNYDAVYSPILPSYHLLEIEIPVEPVVIEARSLKKNWQADFEYSRFIGDQFLINPKHMVLKIPSAVIPEEYNFLINPRHTDFKKLRVVNEREYSLDSRLFG